MNSFCQILFCSLFSVAAIGCSVDPARVNGTPPVTPEVFFKAGTLSGTFETKSDPVAFMWPVEENGKALTREQKIDKRAEIVTKLEILSLKAAAAKPYIDQITGLTIEFLQGQCGLFSASDPNPSHQQVMDWKEPADDEEAKAIQACQLNMMERGKIFQSNPIVGEAKQLKEEVFGVSIGMENVIPVKGLKVDFSVDGSGGEPSIELFGFQGQDFSTTSTDDFYQIQNVVLDRSLGTLRFSVPYIQTKDGGAQLRYIGVYNFELEISGGGSAMTMGGEIERMDEYRGTSSLGRVSFSGAVAQPGAE